MSHRFECLGVGVGFRSPYLGDLFLHRERIDFLEVIADHYFDNTRESLAELDVLASHFTVIPHGLNLSLGSAEGLDREYLTALRNVVDRLQPPWWSEHVAFTRAGGIEIGHLAPLPLRRDALDTLCNNIEVVREFIDVPLILENITYDITLPCPEFDEADFLAELVRRTGCGLLLDLTNLHTNAVNHGLNPRAFLERLPLENVVQIHIAGGHWHGETLVDSHAAATPPEVWALLDEVLAATNVNGLILERDEDLPPFSEILHELEHAREIGRRHRRWV